MLAFLAGGGLLAGGTALLVADNTLRDNQGFFMSGHERFATASYAIESGSLQLGSNAGTDFVPQRLLGDAKLDITPANGTPLFIGVGRSDDVDAFLSGVQHATVTDLVTRNGATVPQYVETPGSAPTTLPGQSNIWLARTSGSGHQTISWPLESGAWKIVVMNANGNANVAADIAAGATFPAVGWVIGGLMFAGACLLVLAAVLLFFALRSASRAVAAPSPPQTQEGPR